MATPASQEHKNKDVLARLDTWLATAPAVGTSAPIGPLIARRQELRAAVKSLRVEKQMVAAEFRSAASIDVAAAKQRMSEATRALIEAENELKLVEGRLAHEFESLPSPAAAQAPDLPPHLTGAPKSSLARDLRIEPLDRRNRSDWDTFVARQTRASLYHDSRWLDIVEKKMRQESLSLLARDADGEVAGVLPLYRLKSILFGDFAVSCPYVNYGGALGVSVGVEEALMRYAAERAERLGLRHLEFRDMARRDGWPCREDKVSMIRRLPASAAALENELGAKLRSQIRRARRENVSIARGTGAEHLEAFYDVFAENMRDLGTPVYARSLFETILRLWPRDATVLLIRLGSKPVGGAFLIRHRDTMEIPWASTLRSANPLSLNMLMYWEALAYAIEQGCRYFDFGRSTRDSGTYRFKRQWGALAVAHYWHYWLAAKTEVPKLNPDNARYARLIDIWRRLPVSVTRLIGPSIVRNLP